MNRFYRHPLLTGVHEQKYYIAHSQSGDRVCVDKALFELWSTLDGQTADQLHDQIGPHLGMTLSELKTVLQTLVKAQLVTTDEPAPGPGAQCPVEDGPLVSVVILNMDGMEHLETCISSVLEQTYRHLEIIMVDNGSQDRSVSYVRERFPLVRVLDLGKNLGFAGGNNEGFKAAQGAYVFCLNNDTELDSSCVAEMVDVIEGDEQVAAVQPMMKLFYLRGFVNSLGNIVPPIGWGYDSYIGHLDVGQFQASTEVYAACFGATLLRRSALDQIGMLDIGYHPIYYDDSDWSYRARLAGYKVVSAPKAIVYHKFGATVARPMSPGKLTLVARNRLRYAAKNLQFGMALRYGASYLAEDLYHALQAASAGDWHRAWAFPRAWGQFVRSGGDVLRQRAQTQRLRTPGETDRALYAVARQTPLPKLDSGVPLLTIEDITGYYARLAPTLASRRVLVVSPDVVNSRMAGPGIRYWELAHVLGRHLDVTLAVPGQCDMAGEGFRVACYETGQRETLQPMVSGADVVVASGYILHEFPSLKQVDKPLAIDLYDPFIIENLHFHADKPLLDRATIHSNDLSVVNDQLQAGDFFICASEKQRDYCLGLLMANNRVNPYTWDRDRALRQLIDVVPFGLRSRRPRSGGPGLKGHHPGIAADDRVILWGGGIWEWLDPLTAIRAMQQVTQTCPKAKLFFIGTNHPNTNFPASRMASRAIELSRELGMLNRCVFFNDWTPYQEREQYLVEADVGISLHYDHLETRLAFRTRLLDYFWAGLPIVTSRGDALSEVVAREELGHVVDFEDVDGVAAALIELLSLQDVKTSFAPAFARVAERFAWERVAEPLVAFCRAPWFAADKGEDTSIHTGVITMPEPTPVWRLPVRAWQILHRRGPAGLWREIVSYVRWSMARPV
jgi:hypothetical protein